MQQTGDDFPHFCAQQDRQYCAPEKLIRKRIAIVNRQSVSVGASGRVTTDSRDQAPAHFALDVALDGNGISLLRLAVHRLMSSSILVLIVFPSMMA